MRSGASSTPHHRMLGVRAVGSLSFSIALLYFVVTGLGGLVVIIAPDPLSFLILSGLVVLGVVMFFLPLDSIHRKMAAAKAEAVAAARSRLVTLESGDWEVESLEDVMRRVGETLRLQMIRQEVSSIPTWPFDTTILGRFIAIILSVTAILLARLITITLHL